jgi:hypothetical protein
MAGLEDKWIEERGTQVDAKLLHAIGLINLLWNTCEHGLLPLFCAATKLRGQMALILVHDLGDVSISTKIRDALPLSPHDQDEKDAITYALGACPCNGVLLDDEVRVRFTAFHEQDLSSMGH